MHRLSEIARLTDLYSESKAEDKIRAAKHLGDNPEIHQTLRNLKIIGREAMQKTRNSKNLAATTKEMRDIAREAHHRGLNRQMKPAQFKLLDPRGTHIISPQFYHDRADGKLVEMHVRCHIHLKLIGKQKAVELFMDIPMHFIIDYLTGYEKLELMQRAIDTHSIERTVDDDGNVLEPTPLETQMIDTHEIKEPNEATPNADNMLSAEGKS